MELPKINNYNDMTVQYLLTKAKADNKNPVQIIDELVSKKVAASAI